MIDERREDEDQPVEENSSYPAEPAGFEAPRHPEAERGFYHPELDQAPVHDEHGIPDPGTVAEEVQGHRAFLSLVRKAVTVMIIAVPLSLFLLRIGWGMVGDGFFNTHVDERPTRLDAAVRDRYRASFIMDWHADSLLWSRELEERSESGHWDLPRAVDGGIDLQMLTIVSETSEPLWLLGLAQEWPIAALWDPAERIIYQIERGQRLPSRARRQPDLPPLVVVDDAEALRRVATGQAMGIMLGLEGIHGIEDGPPTLEHWYSTGVRMASIVHRHDNAYGSSSGGSNDADPGALSDAGRDILQRMRRLGMILDLSHAAPGVIDEALEIYRGGPVVASHTGLRAQCDIDRNLSDEHARRIAENGGLIGIMFAPFTLCGESLDDLVNAIKTAVDVVGEDHVALGSDWDGYISAVVDAAEVPELLAALEASGLSPLAVRKVAGLNSLQFLQRWIR